MASMVWPSSFWLFGSCQFRLVSPKMVYRSDGQFADDNFSQTTYKPEFSPPSSDHQILLILGTDSVL